MNKVLNIPDQDARFRDMITGHLEFINRLCLKTVKLKSGAFLKSEFSIENESDVLFNRVLDKLSDNDFRILRRFEGRSKITTYLATIVARTAVDMIRERAGRERSSDTSGPLKIPDASGTTVKEGVRSGDKGEYIVADPDSSPERTALKTDSDVKMKNAITKMLSALSGDERLLLRMRFPRDPYEEPKTTDEISSILGISKKGVYNRFDRLIKKCRDILSDSGIGADDFMMGEYSEIVRHIKRRVE